MFFTLSKDTLNDFSEHFELLPGIYLNTDEGWHDYTVNNRRIIIKGYADNYSLNDLVTLLTPSSHPTHKGNFLAFIVDNEEISITHDMYRGTPIYLNADNQTISNLDTNGENIWADGLVVIDNELQFHKSNFTPYELVNTTTTDEKIIENIHDILCDNFENFLTHNTLPIKIFISGGLDTLTLYAYLKKFTNNFELVDYEYMKFTHFYKKNQGKLKKLWGYNQTHLWDEHCVLVTGGNGDENFLRGPLTLNLMLMHHGTNIPEVLNGYESDYLYRYFMKKTSVYEEMEEEYAGTSLIQDFNKVRDHILNVNINDHQHWHLDKTLNFTPFKNLDILSLVLQSSKEMLGKHTRYGYINEELIKLLDPDVLKLRSVHKNSDKKLYNL
jgi:hypothetical protein